MYRIIETEVKDSRGEVIISPGLKVRHKDSQFEYTVDGVIGGDGDNLQVVLRLPEEPRFEPTEEPGKIIRARSKSNPNLIYEIDPSAIYYEPSSEEMHSDSEEEIQMISVSQEEFEKEYEVK